MSPSTKPTLLYMIHEHNSLNGFRFVIVEFILVTAAALLIAASGILHARILMSVAGIGIAVNAIAVIAIAAHQSRMRDKQEGILKFRSSSVRAKVGSEHPNLGNHTLTVMFAVLIPFLLTAVISIQERKAER